MPILSKLSTPVPTVSIPDFVFKSRDAPLPETPLLISAEDPDRFFSLSSYRDWSCRFAAGLRASGVEPGDRLFLASHNTVYNAVVFMGTVMAGAIFVGAQATYSVEHLAMQLGQTKPKVLLGTESVLPKLVMASRVASQEREIIYVFDEFVHGGTTHWTNLLLNGQMARDFTWESLNSKEATSRTASLIYSSGSTGFPKGIELSHHQLIASAAQNNANISALTNGGLDDQGASAPLCYMSMSQNLGQWAACIRYPSQNLPLIIARNSDFLSVMNYISKFQITSLLINPSFLVAINKTPEMRENLKGISSLRLLILIGSPLDYGLYEELIDLWRNRVGKIPVILHSYGMTELGGGVAINSMESREGKTLLYANVEMKVIELSGEKEIANGMQGELCVRGPNVAKGYWQNPKATEASFAKDGWLKTGDLATIDDSGAMNVLARVQDLIRVDGQHIIPLHIERVLLSHPEVQEAVVYGVSDSEIGTSKKTQADGTVSENQKIRAYIVKDKGFDLTTQDVENFLAERAPGLKRLSGGVVFLDNIPKNTGHKPDKPLLIGHR